MDANELANRVAHEMLAGEGTGPAWGIRIEEARQGVVKREPDMIPAVGMTRK